MPAATMGPSAPGERLGGAWIEAAGPKTRRATAMVQSSSSGPGSGAAAIFVSGLARKFWTMISCTAPCRVVDVAERQQRLDALPPCLADADQDAGGERESFASPASRMVSSRRAGSLSGEP